MISVEQPWIKISDVAKILGISEKSVKTRCREGKLNYKISREGCISNYYIHFNSLPECAKNKYLGLTAEADSKYSEAPEWAKSQVEKYITVLKKSEGLKGEQLKNFIEAWNNQYENNKVSYPSIIKMRRRFRDGGVNSLLAKYGHTGVRAQIKDDEFDYFKNLYLVEGAPSLKSCWELTLGYAMKTFNAKKSTFPSYMAFKRRLDREVPKQSIYLARQGYSAWNRKYGSYIDRDYSSILCGKVWVSDHAQIDVACFTPEGNVVFPWVTAWRDYKSGKWLGWLLQYNHPNSDHIFQTFYYAAETYGLPSDVIIDNGKDYRSKDFAGGRKNIKVDVSEPKTTSMLGELGVEVNFALPYNAQTKPIERDFLKIKELLSKHCIGYRGGNVVERPEKLADEIKKGKIMHFDDFKRIFDDFIVNVLNKRPSMGKNLNGLCPDELFNQEFTEKITPSKDALKLFCMRTSRNFTIGRNGIKDNSLGITYWNDWLISQTGVKVYLRRDVQNYKAAWVFRADNDEFLGTVEAVRAVAALHADKISKEEFKEAMSIKKRNLKIAKAYIQQTREIPLEEQCENYKNAYSSVERENKKVQVSKLANTNMDKAIRKNKEMESFGKFDLSKLIDENPKQEKSIYLFETDRILDEELLEVANGS